MHLGPLGQSCVSVCRRSSHVCEPALFHHLNSPAAFKRSEPKRFLDFLACVCIKSGHFHSFFIFQTRDRLLCYDPGSQPPVPLLQSVGSTLWPPAGAAAVQLCRLRPILPQAVSMQSPPAWTGGAVPRLRLNHSTYCTGNTQEILQESIG